MSVATRMKKTFKTLFFYKSALAGSMILLLIIGFAVYTVVTYPYDLAIKHWRAGEKIWLDNPRYALPEWITLFTGGNPPRTIILTTTAESRNVKKIIVPISENMSYVRIDMSFNYEYDDYPSEINIFFNASFKELNPRLDIIWIKPDGENITLKSKVLNREDRYYISADLETKNLLAKKVQEKFGLNETPYILPERYLFSPLDKSVLDPNAVNVLKGVYTLRITGYLYENASNVDVKLVVYGKVYGWAGTDNLRRPISIAIMWGTPIALSFGVIAAVTIGLIQMIIAAISAWYGGFIDDLIQRITDINLILPFFPILLMISIFYKFNIWVLLVIVIALSIFGTGVKNYRALFLQLRESPYVEAALSYGASNLRIIFRYLVPKILPLIIPSIVLSVADFVFLEAALAVLGLGDPAAPTWGKVINDALEDGALYKGLYYWVLEPAALLVLTAIAFSLIGFTLEKIFNPRLREM
ncbi:MAG: ABC transporter permease [Thermofilum sp. ex4484_82]|nr:MAG: ABC transporter permease [Thermofilum sp. ex4484_82]OYT39682.1 MAG: ABC transporter permease [Archaeoglobales archaeon ex4484_92]RLF99720.1 MAG: ABC transporter permease [Candidatus Wolframiiraptor sp.]